MDATGAREEVLQGSSGNRLEREPGESTLSTEFLKFLKLSNSSAGA
jgi:hypothetical protein